MKKFIKAVFAVVAAVHQDIIQVTAHCFSIVNLAESHPRRSIQYAVKHLGKLQCEFCAVCNIEWHLDDKSVRMLTTVNKLNNDVIFLHILLRTFLLHRATFKFCMCFT